MAKRAGIERDRPVKVAAAAGVRLELEVHNNDRTVKFFSVPEDVDFSLDAAKTVEVFSFGNYRVTGRGALTSRTKALRTKERERALLMVTEAHQPTDEEVKANEILAGVDARLDALEERTDRLMQLYGL